MAVIEEAFRDGCQMIKILNMVKAFGESIKREAESERGKGAMKDKERVVVWKADDSDVIRCPHCGAFPTMVETDDLPHQEHVKRWWSVKCRNGECHEMTRFRAFGDVDQAVQNWYALVCKYAKAKADASDSRAVNAAEQTCKWKSEDGEKWKTECGQTRWFVNGMNDCDVFCMSCGKRIQRDWDGFVRREETLLPCPCGERPTIDFDFGPYQWVITCGNSDCSGLRECRDATIRGVIRKWNLWALSIARPGACGCQKPNGENTKSNNPTRETDSQVMPTRADITRLSEAIEALSARVDPLGLTDYTLKYVFPAEGKDMDIGRNSQDARGTEKENQGEASPQDSGGTAEEAKGAEEAGAETKEKAQSHETKG